MGVRSCATQGDMPRFKPFAGLRYSSSLRLDDCICPPYDIVGPEERERLGLLSESNAIHVELPAEDPERGLDRYQAAARTLAAWRAGGVLELDGEPSFYVLRMTLPDGTTTRGVIGALGCEAPGGEVLPHEETIPKDKSDRLDLLRACRSNLSPIWGLSLASGLAKLCLTDDPPQARAVDSDGVIHELWQVSDPSQIQSISSTVAGSPVVIADGHHRYETALAYQAECGPGGPDPAGADHVMAFVVELSADELSVRPIHRALHGLAPGLDASGGFEELFSVARCGPGDDASIERSMASGGLTLLSASTTWSLVPRPDAPAKAGSDLDSSIVARAVESIPGAFTSHHHSVEAAVAAVRTGEADAAVLLRPVTVDQIALWARDRRRMPPKTTYFYPKPATGMVFRSLDEA